MLAECNRVFKAQVDTIEAHGGNPGYHGALLWERLNAYMVKKDVTLLKNKRP